tara:strand:- start:71 stop:589 length:519 start_codon:yes stop_codon:yes gene_type:complete
MSFFKSAKDYDQSLRGRSLLPKEISLANLKKAQENNKGKNHWLYGKKHTEETKAKLRAARAKQVNVVTKHSEEAKQKIRDARAKQVFSDETRAKMSKSAKNRPPISDETRAKLSITNNRVYTYYTPYGTFNSAGEAHKVTGLLPQTIRKKCDDPNNPDWSRNLTNLKNRAIV